MYQPKTGQRCTCTPGLVRDNCPTCEGTGWVIDFEAIRSKPQALTGDPMLDSIPPKPVPSLQARFWLAYEAKLAECVAADPEEYWTNGESPESYAARVAYRLRVAAAEAKSFAGIHYTASKAFRYAAKVAGIPFNLQGLNSILKEF